MKPLLLALYVLLSVFLLYACAGSNKTGPTEAAPKETQTAIGAFGIDTVQMDTSVKPGDDFYKYVNGKWLSTFKIPEDKANYGVFVSLVDKSENDIHSLLDELGKTPPAAGSVQKKVVDFYNSWMDEKAIESRGVEPLNACLETTNGAKTKDVLVKLMGNFDYAGPVGLYIIPDPADPKK